MLQTAQVNHFELRCRDTKLESTSESGHLWGLCNLGLRAIRASITYFREPHFWALLCPPKFFRSMSYLAFATVEARRMNIRESQIEDIFATSQSC